MELEMRELRGDDLFTLLPIIGKLDIKNEFVRLFEEQDTAAFKLQDHQKKQPTKAEKERIEKEIEKRGMRVMADLLQTALQNIGNIKEDINTLFADLCGVSIKEIKELSLKDYTSLIVAFFKKPELKDFFTSIASLLQ
jgi:hypothetical protein